MTSPDPEIDGGLPWIRGVDPAAGTRPGSRQDPAQEPTPKPPGSRGGSDPATNLGTDFTEEKPALEPTSRKRNPPRNRLHSRETRPPSKKVTSPAVQRKHPFPSHDEDLACVTMGNFFVPIELRCVFLRESLPSLPTNKTLLLFPRKAVGAFFPTKAQDGFSHHNRTLLANSQRSRPTDDPDLVSLSFAPF